MTTTAAPPAASGAVPSIEEIRVQVQEVFKRRACRWQCLAAQAILSRKHVFIDVGTGMGKTLLFFLCEACDGNADVRVRENSDEN